MPDAAFSHPRLAAIYDDVDGERDDLDMYVALVAEFGARSVIDVGCGTGSLACRLAALDLDVVGVDPAAASLDVAQRKPHADRVRWMHGDARALGDVEADRWADLLVMTGNVAQVFLTDEMWHTTLVALRAAAVDDAVLVFEARDPAARAWRRWTRDDTQRVVDTSQGRVECWVDVTEVALPFVSFRWTYRFLDDDPSGEDSALESDSTLRFRRRDELAQTLRAAGWSLDDVRDAPDRPGLELVVIATPM